MKKVKIVTDSAADLPSWVHDEEEITVLPMTVYFGDEEFRDGVDITPSNFYSRIRQKDAQPKTAQPRLNDVRETLQKLSADGSSIVVIHLSSGLSGTYATTEMVAEEMRAHGADISVVDSLSASFGQGWLVLCATRMARAGACRDEILSDLNQRIPRMNHLFILDTIEFLMRGGRISKTEAFVGTVLDVKPILYIDDHGKILAKGKTRGRKRSITQLLQEVEARMTHPELQTVGVIHADCPDEADELIEELKRRINPREIIKAEMTATVGTHVGPGLLGITFETDLGRE